MTREEAIEWLTDIKNVTENWSHDVAIDMAIEALTHEIRTETHECVKETHDTDLISRADAIEAVRLETGKLGRGLLGKGDILDIIEALPSADAVSREWYDDAVKANHELAFTDLPDIPRYHYEKVVGNMAHEINMLREQLESADAVQGEWIPCSERLPEAPTFCLVTTDGSYNDVIDIALYMSDGWHKASKVLAWMPLPKPYKGGDDE